MSTTGYCKVISVSTENSSIGDDRYVLTHECGKVEKRVARKRGSSKKYPAPARVKCENAPAASTAPTQLITRQRVQAALRAGGHVSSRRSSAGYAVTEEKGVLVVREDDGLGRRSSDAIEKALQAIHRYQVSLEQKGIRSELHRPSGARPYLTIIQPAIAPAASEVAASEAEH